MFALLVFFGKIDFWHCRICICNKLGNFKDSGKYIRRKCMHFLWAWLVRDVFAIVNIQCFLPAWNSVLCLCTNHLHWADFRHWLGFGGSPLSLVRGGCIFPVYTRGKCCLSAPRPDFLAVVCLQCTLPCANGCSQTPSVLEVLELAET